MYKTDYRIHTDYREPLYNKSYVVIQGPVTVLVPVDKDDPDYKKQVDTVLIHLSYGSVNQAESANDWGRIR